MPKFRTFGFLFAVVAFLLPQASAGVMTQDFQLTGSLENPAPLAIDKFDPLLGALTEVRMSYDLLGAAQFLASDPNSVGLRVEFFDVSSSVEFGPFLGGPLLGQGAAVLFGTQGLPGELTISGIGFGYVMGQGSAVLTDTGTLDAFTVSGVADTVLNLPISTTPLQTPQLSILRSVSHLSGNLSVTYLFEDSVATSQPAPNAAVPEPASLAILGIGAIVMVRTRRRTK